MAVRVSNNLIGILNLISFLLSVAILGGGIWLSHNGSTECERFLDRPLIAIGVFLMVVSLAGFIGACYGVSCLLWLYLVVMFILIVAGIALTIFAFAVTNKGAGKALDGRGYKEYRLGDYSNWLQKRVTRTKNWNRIKNCLADSKVCSGFENEYLNDTVQQFYEAHLTALQSGCCKPSNDCGFTYVGPTNWTQGSGASFTNPDCRVWDNNPSVLCFDCESCKAGLLDNIRSQWKKVAVVNIVFLIFLIIVYSVGCCAFRNNRRDNYAYGRGGGWKA